MVEIKIDEEQEELPFDHNFIEQAEYISEDDFMHMLATHPEEASILRRLSVGGAKLLVGPRGCGKTTLMRKAFFGILRDENTKSLPVYVNFKLSLKIEPLYSKEPNAPYLFRVWLNLKVLESIHETAILNTALVIPAVVPPLEEVKAVLSSIERNEGVQHRSEASYSTETLISHIELILEANELTRCVLLLDDAAHAFSPRQQQDFFEFFRQVKRSEISPKAAIYPGIVSQSPTFHVGHDAEEINVWIRPDKPGYLKFMRQLAERRFDGQLPNLLDAESLNFLAFASFGIPRSFLNMLRDVYHLSQRSETRGRIPSRNLFEIARTAREASHNIYESLKYKLPSFKNFVASGEAIYQQMINTLKEFNKVRAEDNQGLEIGIKRPITPEIEKIIGFLQYAGLVMHSGEISRGVKGIFQLFKIHYGDLITENAVIGKRSKSVKLILSALTSHTTQAWPRISCETLADPAAYNQLFKLQLANCSTCGAERVNEQAKFCHNCGAPLKSVSLFDELVNQDISVLHLSDKMVKRIKENSAIRTVKDLLVDTDHKRLRSIKHIGPVRANRIVGLAEEHVA